MRKIISEYIKSDNLINKTTIIYISIFLILFIFSIFNLYGLDSVSLKAYSFLGIMVIMTVIGLNIGRKNLKLDYKKIEIKIKEKTLSYFFSGIFGVCIFYLIKYLYLIRNIPYAEVRIIRYTTLFSCGIEYVFFNYMMTNIIVLFEIIFCLNLFSNKKVLSKTNSVLMILCIITYCLIGFSRMGLLNIVMVCALSLGLFNEQKLSSKKKIKYIFMVGITIFALALLMVYFRTRSSFESVLNAQFKQVFVYFLGPFRAFDQFLNIGFPDLMPSLGRATLGGIDEIISYFLSFIGQNITSYNEYLGTITQKEIIIGNAITFNAFYTASMNFYMDLGITGIIVFSFLHGAMVNCALRLDKTKLINKVLISYMILNLFKTYLNWPYQHGMNLFLLIVLVLFASFFDFQKVGSNNGIFDKEINSILVFIKKHAVIFVKSSIICNFVKECVSKLSKHTILYFKNFNKEIINKGNVDLESNLEGKNVINKKTNIYHSTIGLGTYIGEDSNVVFTKIGRFCSIGNNFKIVCFAHPTTKYVSTHPAFFSTKKQAGFTFVNEDNYEERVRLENSDLSVEIGNDVWIGENVTIMGGVRIGDGAIIGANALVTKDIEPYSINVGVPAKKIKYRFHKNDIEYLQELKWWTKETKQIKENAKYFNDIDELRKCSKW